MNKFLILLFSFITFNLFSQNLTTDDISRIESGTYALRERSSYTNLELLPEGMEIEEDFKKDISTYKPEVCVEMLYVIERPTVDGDLTLYLLNSLKAFSKQVGIEYFSNRKQAMSLLIEESYFTTYDGETALEDPIATTLTPFKNEFYFQKDTTFGSNRYKLKTVTRESTIWLQMENLENLSVYKFFKALDAGGQRTNFIVNVKEDKVYIYALAQIKEEPKLKKILTYDVNIPFSFERRMNSVITWYKDSL